MKQINKQQLAELTNFKDAKIAGRQLRKITTRIKETAVECTAAPDNPGTLTNGKGSGGAAATAVHAGAESSSVITSEKNKGNKGAGGKVAGRKRTMKMADDGGSGDDGGKDESGGGERPKKMPKHFKGKHIVASEKLEAAEGGGDDVDAGEA